jgi:hypothetical protein
MRSLTTLDDWSAAVVLAVFALADAYSEGRGPAAEGAAVMFFPPSSLRTSSSRTVPALTRSSSSPVGSRWPFSTSRRQGSASLRAHLSCVAGR